LIFVEQPRKGAMLVGYARVSKADDSDTAAQVKALRQAGYTSRALSQCDPIAKGVYLPTGTCKPHRAG
jgi:hypothetical protein